MHLKENFDVSNIKIVYVDLQYDEDNDDEVAEFTKDLENLMLMTESFEPYVTTEIEA